MTSTMKDNALINTLVPTHSDSTEPRDSSKLLVSLTGKSRALPSQPLSTHSRPARTRDNTDIMPRQGDPFFMVKIGCHHCNCFADCYPCNQHGFSTDPDLTRILIGCARGPGTTCGSNISFQDVDTYLSIFQVQNALPIVRLRIYRMRSPHCPSVIQVEACQTLGPVERNGKRIVLRCGCFIFFSCCRDPSPDYDGVIWEEVCAVGVLAAPLGQFF